MKLRIAALAFLLLAGCSSAPDRGEDPGIYRCKRIAANFASGERAELPTQAQIDEVRQDFANSKYEALSAAGVGYADAAEKALYGAGENISLMDMLGRQALLETACTEQGVALVFPAPSMPTIPTMPPLDVPPLPTNPFDPD